MIKQINRQSPITPSVKIHETRRFSLVFISALALLLFAGCGGSPGGSDNVSRSPHSPFIYNSSDPYFNRLSEEFIKDCSENMDPLLCLEIGEVPVNFEDPARMHEIAGAAVHGLCITYGDRSEVLISTEALKFLSEAEFKSLIYHELAHAQPLGMGHDSFRTGYHHVFTYGSIMNDEGFHDTDWAWEGYVEQLFKGGDPVGNAIRDSYVKILSNATLGRLGHFSFFNDSELRLETGEAEYIYRFDYNEAGKSYRDTVFYKKVAGGSVVSSGEVRYVDLRLDYNAGSIKTPHAQWRR